MLQRDRPQYNCKKEIQNAIYNEIIIFFIIIYKKKLKTINNKLVVFIEYLSTTLFIIHKDIKNINNININNNNIN